MPLPRLPSLPCIAAGKAKDVLNVIMSTVVFHNPLSSLQIFGYAIALSGVCYYTYLKISKKLTAEKAKKKERAVGLV